LLEALDAVLTTLDIRDGDLADVCQNVRWQADLFRSRKLERLSKRVVPPSERFVEAFAAREVTTGDYPKLIAGLLPALKEAAAALKSEELAEAVRAMQDVSAAKKLQRRHWEYLNLLADLVG
jgi:hypothetical protein